MESRSSKHHLHNNFRIRQCADYGRLTRSILLPDHMAVAGNSSQFGGLNDVVRLSIRAHNLGAPKTARSPPEQCDNGFRQAGSRFRRGTTRLPR